MMRNVLMFLAGVGALALSLQVQEVQIRWAVWRYGVDEGFLRTLLRVENGGKGFEAGLNAPTATSVYRGDLQAYADPTMPDGCLQHARIARRIVLDVQRWVFTDAKRRDEFLWDFSHGYHGAGNGKDWLGHSDRDYYVMLTKVWSEEQKVLKERRIKGTYHPFMP